MSAIQPNRDSKGRFLPGNTMPEELKEAIRQGQISRHRRNYVPPPQNLKKRCTVCGRTKRVPEDYTMRKRKLASGEIRRYPSGECKSCQAKRSAAWRENLRRDPEAASREYRKWNKRRNKAHRKRYQRDYQRMQRAMDPSITRRGPWKKYRGELEKPLRGTSVDIEPVKPWLEDWYEYHGSDERFTEITGVSARTLRRWLDGQPRAPLDVVEHVLTKLGRPDLAVSLRPLQ